MNNRTFLADAVLNTFASAGAAGNKSAMIEFSGPENAEEKPSRVRNFAGNLNKTLCEFLILFVCLIEAKFFAVILGSDYYTFEYLFYGNQPVFRSDPNISAALSVESASFAARLIFTFSYGLFIFWFTKMLFYWCAGEIEKMKQGFRNWNYDNDQSSANQD